MKTNMKREGKSGKKKKDKEKQTTFLAVRTAKHAKLSSYLHPVSKRDVLIAVWFSALCDLT